MKELFLLLSFLIVFVACSGKKNVIDSESTFATIEVDSTYFGPCRYKAKYCNFPQYPKLSAAIQTDVDKCRNELKEESDERKLWPADDNSESCTNCELILSDTIYRADDCFVSVVLRGKMDFMCHPGVFDMYYNYDVKGDKMLSISDILKIDNQDNIDYFNRCLEECMAGLRSENFGCLWGDLWSSEEFNKYVQKPTIEGMAGFSFSCDTMFIYYGQYAFGFNEFKTTSVRIPIESLRPIMKSPL